MNDHTGTQPVETPRLLLRRLTVADADAMYHNWANDPEVARFMRWQAHKNVDETRAILAEWVKQYDDPNYYNWTITLKETGTPIGGLGIFPEHEPGEDPGAWTPGYCIGRAYWGKGYTTEALFGALNAFIAATGVTRLTCCHGVANPASGAVMRKAGFVFDHEGTYHTFDGTEHPALYYRFDEASFRKAYKTSR